MFKWWEDMMGGKQKESRGSLEQTTNAIQAARESQCLAVWWEAYRVALHGIASKGFTPTAAAEWASEAALRAEIHYRERSLQRDKRVAGFLSHPPDPPRDDLATEPTINLRTPKPPPPRRPPPMPSRVVKTVGNE
jgi:hypothetical protein